MPKVKKIPLRMCVGCQEMKPKKQLVRVVRTPDEKIEVDLTGKRSGRGAYICPDLECLTKAIKGKRLDRALQRPVGQDVVDALRQKLVK
ncbi:MAG: YlxR family protein [Desulfotomaculaceae bacterium]|nr:YlxR family protein [Desulfotomaculaceae bacterium]